MNLYIDFDGVVLDTITVTYRMLEEQNIDKNDFEATNKFYKKLDWNKILRETPQINDSINCIKKLMKNSYNCFILTHVTSLDEAVAKINYLVELIPDITIIPVPKMVSKTKMIHTKGSILVDDFGGNLDEWAKEGGLPVKFSLKTDKKYDYPSIDRLDKLMDLFPIQN
jgi:hypothetical protein